MMQMARDICMDREDCLHKTHRVLAMESQAILGDMEVDMWGDSTRIITAINCLVQIWTYFGASEDLQGYRGWRSQIAITLSAE
jgi:hypothetical protein